MEKRRIRYSAVNFQKRQISNTRKEKSRKSSTDRNYVNCDGPCPHNPKLYKTEREHQDKLLRSRQYHARQQAANLDYRLKRLLYSIKHRCASLKRKDAHWYAEKGLENTLTLEQLKKLWFRDKAYNLKRPTIDRKENNLGYSFNNCHFIEHSENVRRGTIDRKPRGYWKKKEQVA